MVGARQKVLFRLGHVIDGLFRPPRLLTPRLTGHSIRSYHQYMMPRSGKDHLRMPLYKFVAVKGGDGNPSELTRSIRSHAIRAGLQKKQPRQSRSNAEVPPLRFKEMSNELAFRFQSSEGMRLFQDCDRPTLLTVDSTAQEYSPANAKSASEVSAEVKL